MPRQNQSIRELKNHLHELIDQHGIGPVLDAVVDSLERINSSAEDDKLERKIDGMCHMLTDANAKYGEDIDAALG